MATPAEQLANAQKNLAAAQAAGDTAKIQSLTDSVNYYQQLNDANQGISPNTTPNNNNATVTQNADGGWTQTNNGTTDKFNSKGELVDSNADRVAVNNTTTNEPTSTLQQQQQANAEKPLSEIQSIEIKSDPVVNANSNGDPNPNAVVTPPTEDQPSNLKVAGVDVTPVTDTGDETNRLLARYPAPATTTTTPTPPQKTPDGKDDWRVKLSLAKKADYLYKDANIKSTNILYPLVETDGVIFPYVPEIRVNYKANYNNVDVVHTNYKNYFYTNSSVDEISIQGIFTAQDNVEAKYMLAVIHFFRSVTKMFYGQDTDPRGGTPPPLCFLTGLGSHQFENHPLVVTGFSYNLPNDVDYVRADTSNAYSAGGIPVEKAKDQIKQKSNIFSRFLSSHRLGSSSLNKQAKPSQPNFKSITFGEESVTYVPSKLQITLQCLPIVSRNNVSNKFKLNGKDSYGSGELITKGFW